MLVDVLRGILRFDRFAVYFDLGILDLGSAILDGSFGIRILLSASFLRRCPVDVVFFSTRTFCTSGGGRRATRSANGGRNSRGSFKSRFLDFCKALATLRSTYCNSSSKLASCEVKVNVYTHTRHADNVIMQAGAETQHGNWGGIHNVPYRLHCKAGTHVYRDPLPIGLSCRIDAADEQPQVRVGIPINNFC